MRLILSCFRCGSTDFDHAPIECQEIEGNYYLPNENVEGTQVTCSKCGLEDYVENLVITFR